jgi:UPF0755 protein
VVEPPDLNPPTPPRRRRSGPTQRQLRARRAAAAGTLALAVVVAIVLVQLAVGGSGDDAASPATTSVATAPGPPPLRIVFPEGFTRAQMAARIIAVNQIAMTKRKLRPRLRAGEYLAATESWSTPKWFEPTPATRPLEGFLFPATYEFVKTTPTKALVADQLAAFRREWSKVDLAYARTKQLTPYDVLIIASMVEKEVRAPRERALVAAVIYNRLKAGMPLGIDATIRYGLKVPPTEALTQTDLDADNPYNTRRNAGLPPTPIASPGLAAMRAAAKPAQVDYLYFVRRADCKTHFFTASADEFYAAVASARC